MVTSLALLRGAESCSSILAISPRARRCVSSAVPADAEMQVWLDAHKEKAIEIESVCVCVCVCERERERELDVLGTFAQLCPSYSDLPCTTLSNLFLFVGLSVMLP
jgi:hypothetical protein